MPEVIYANSLLSSSNSECESFRSIFFLFSCVTKMETLPSAVNASGKGGFWQTSKASSDSQWPLGKSGQKVG